MTRLNTWRNGSTFSYEGRIDAGGETGIKYGQKSTARITAKQWKDLLREFEGREVRIGTSRSESESRSLGMWLKKNVSQTALASYVGAILIAEGYASHANGGQIRFNRLPIENYVGSAPSGIGRIANS